MGDLPKSCPDFLQLASDYSARYRKATLQLAVLDNQLADLRKEHAEILADNERKRQEGALLDEEIKMLDESINYINQQVTFNREVARPQLRAEAKRLTELVETKKKYYKEKLDNCAKLWETYEAKYNKFPRVAERNELELKVKLLRIEVMQARQDMIDKQKQAEEWQQIQALQAEVLRKEFKELYHKDQEVKMKNEAILKEIEETKARIAQREKQLEDQRRSEEEKQRKLKDDELELQALHDTTLDEIQKPDCSTSSAEITIPTLSIPKLDDILPLSAFSQKTFEGLQDLKRKVSSLEFPKKQAAKLKTFLSISRSSVGQSEAIGGSQKVLHSTCSSTINNTGSTVDFQMPTKFAKLENNNCTVVQSINHARSRSPSSSGGNKKELMFRTDSIVAIMKETLPANTKLPTTAGQNSADIDSSKVHQEIYSAKNVTQEIQKNVHFEQKLVVDVDATQCNELRGTDRTTRLEKDARDKGDDPDPKETQVHDDKAFESCGAMSQDIFASDLDENGGTPPKDQAYDFNNEFGDDLYNSLGSPPQFDSVMSPVHASFDSSPPLSIDENTKEPSQPFSYDFFSQTSSNYFGGPSKDDKKNEKPKAATSYSFLF